MKTDTISFKGVYKTEKQFSPTQHLIGKNIKQKLTSQNYSNKNGLTPDEIFKKKGFDTVLSPTDNDTVDVFVTPSIKNGVRVQTRDSYYVGTYDKNSEFNPDDIKKKINSLVPAWSLFVLPVAGLFACCILGMIKNNENRTIENRPITENTVTKKSVQDSIKVLSADTFKVIKNRK